MKPSHDTDWMLIVEDQLDAWTVLKAHLGRVLPQVELVHHTGASTALSYLHHCLAENQRLPRMVLSDLYMPRLEDGLLFLTRLKEPASCFRHLPVVIISSSTRVEDRQEVNRSGGTFQPKPVVMEEWGEFLKTIGHYWRKSPTQPMDNGLIP